MAGTKYLKTEGLLTYGALTVDDIDQATRNAFEASDRHSINADGTITFIDKDGSEQLVPVGTDKATVNTSAVDPDVIKKAADISYLSQKTGVKTTDMNAVYESLGIDPKDTMASVKKDAILKSFGYNPGSGTDFYGNNSAVDLGAQILVERDAQRPTEQDIIDAGLDPEKVSIVNSNTANSIYLAEKLAEQGVDFSATSGVTGSSRAQYERQKQTTQDLIKSQAPSSYWANKMSETGSSLDDLQLDVLEWDLIKKTKIEDPGYDPSGTSGGLTGTINTGGGNITTGGNITGGATGDGTYTGPDFVSTPNIGAITPVYGEDQTGLTEVDIPTYEAGLGLQQTQFENRAAEQAKLYQPQTLAEQQAAGTAPAFENVLYRNRFGMSMYVQHINGVPSQPIPPGYYRVQGFGTEAQTQGGSASQTVQGNNQGGVIPKQANIAGQPHRLAYVNPQEEKLLKAAGGVGAPSYGGVPAYFTLGQGTTVGQVATDPTTGTKYTWNGTSWDITLSSGESAGTTTGVGAGVDTSQTGTNGTIAAQSSNTVNPAMNFQPGGEVVQAADGTYKIKYPDGTYSQGYDTALNAMSAITMGNTNLGLPDYGTYLQQQGYDMNLPGYNQDQMYAAYQSYLQDPATLQNIQAQQQQEQTPETGGINAEQPTGQMDVTAEDLAQAQRDLVAQSTVAPGGAVAAAPTSYIDPNTYGTVVESTAGQALGTAPMVQEDQVAQIGSATTADVPVGQGAATYDANQAFGDVQTATEGMTAAQMDGPTKEIEAATATGTSVSGLDAATGESVDVTGSPTRELETIGGQSELITGTGVDQSKVMAAFGEGEIKAASVQDELTGLMQQFEGGNTPAWASGAMRAAMATLAARGLGASSMAGQAVIQAAMEAALPIAQIDAGNKQQMALFKGEQRAKFLQIEFDQAFQAKVMNAAKISEIANMNFTAQQQIALENSKAANTMALQNLSNEQALVMAEAAALSQLDTQNLNNRQQAAVQNAQNFLQIDMANLANEQQTALFKQQSLINSILSDQAASNAAAQFNATSENQTNQFFSNLAASVNQFNAAQMNAMKQFNADEVNSLLEFNASIQNQREMFNAQNYLVVAQANAQWRQNLATINTAAANESNMEYAQTVNALTLKTLDEIWQRERDLMDYSFTSSENAADRALSILLGDKQLSAIKQQIDSQEDQALGTLLTKVFFSSDFKSIFDSSE